MVKQQQNNMKLKQRFIILLFISLTPFLLDAQAPGYLGKRAAVSFNVSGGVAIDGPTQNNKGSNSFGNQSFGEESELGFNHEFVLDFSYTLSRYRSVRLSGSQYYTGMVSEARTTSLDGSGSDFHDLFYRLNVKTISMDYSFYSRKRGALAPVGGHYYVGLKTSMVSGEIIDKRTDFNNPPLAAILGHKLLDIDQKKKLYYFTWGWSNSSVFADKVIFKAGISGAIPLGWFIGRGNIGRDNNFDSDNQTTFEDNVFTRLWAHEILRMNVGIGYLLF